VNDQGTISLQQDPEPIARRKALRTTAAAVIAVFIGLFLGAAGVLKLLDFARFANYYAEAGQPRWVFFGSGVIEILAGAAMLVPRFRQHAAWALLGMIFLIAWAPWKVPTLLFLVAQTVAILSLVLLVWPLRSRP
jgi:uncharacterized membrane protein